MTWPPSPKPLVVGMLTLRAMEAGKLCLWDRLGTFLDAPPDKRDITIAQILTHTAGFPTGLHLWELSDQPENSAETILNAPLASPPGARGTLLLRGVHFAGAAAGVPLRHGTE